MNERRVFLPVAGINQICMEQSQENQQKYWERAQVESAMKGRSRRRENKIEPAETQPWSL